MFAAALALAGALDAFEVEMGDLPGVDTPDAPEPGIGDRTRVVRAMHAHWDQLTDEQRDAFMAAVAPESELIASFGRSRPAQITDDRLHAIAESARNEFSSRTAHAMIDVIEIHRVDSDTVADDGSWAYSEPPASSWHDTPLETPVESRSACHIYVGNRLLASTGDALQMLIAHEVFHCYQMDSFGGTMSAWGGAPSWIIEGGAAWAGLEFAGGGNELSASWWDQYLGGSEGAFSLFASDYDAVGTYAYADQQGHSPWLALLPMVRMSNVEAFVTLVDVDPVLLNGWASGTTRTGWTPAWQTGGVGITATARSPVGTELARREVVEIGAPAASQRVAALTPAPDLELVFVQLAGPSVSSWEGESELVWGGESTVGGWCLVDECLCPDGRPPRGMRLPRAPEGSALWVAVSGGPDEPGKVRAIALRLEDLCEPCEGAAPGGGGRSRARIESRRAQEGECNDPCLDSAWRLDNTAYGNAILGGAPYTYEIGGAFILKFDGHRWAARSEGFNARVEISFPGIYEIITGTYTGETGGVYRGFAGSLTIVEDGGGIAYATEGTGTFEIPASAGVSPIGAGDLTYICDDTTLSLLASSASGSIETFWYRIDGEVAFPELDDGAPITFPDF